MRQSVLNSKLLFKKIQPENSINGSFARIWKLLICKKGENGIPTDLVIISGGLSFVIRIVSIGK